LNGHSSRFAWPLHSRQAIAALERGVAVFCQKPLAPTAEQTRRVGAIPKDSAPIFDRLSVDNEMWVASVKNFGRGSHRAAGRVEHLMQAGPPPASVGSKGSPTMR
jgi:hypothetical protein